MNRQPPPRIPGWLPIAIIIALGFAASPERTLKAFPVVGPAVHRAIWTY